MGHDAVFSRRARTTTTTTDGGEARDASSVILFLYIHTTIDARARRGASDDGVNDEESGRRGRGRFKRQDE